MIEEDYKNGWRQHFPTYHFEDRDIALEEYKVAAKNLESEERVFLNASNVSLVSSAALGSLLVGSSDRLASVFEGIIPPYIISIILLLIISGFSFVTLKYFSDRQRSIVFSGRKVIVLRRMLGLSYGRIQLLLPNWRVEGADQPLAVRLFPGWFTYVAYPFWIVSIISTSVVFFLIANLVKQNQNVFNQISTGAFIACCAIIWFVATMLVYRTSLLDVHETSRLIFYRLLAKAIGLPLVENIEYIIYRAKLSFYETERLGIKTKRIKDFLIHIEDRRFYNHNGINYKSILRSILGLVKIKPRSGGSTIVQQVIRTLFISDLQKTYRRKFIELSLAPWLTNVFSKNIILDIYISAVRFEKGCFGIVEAMEYFWCKVEKNPTNAQAFFLIERVSNVRSQLLVLKIIETAKSAKNKGLMKKEDLNDLVILYEQAVINNKIVASSDKLKLLRDSLGA
ncbi:biosynthetic peptidoglycan transglycosylase [Halomonas sp. GD1P12]|uniref:biosynthetic peptidoglycan transglycosylase n=1 Tax=Halomonas sp. GD1P12 TaxID=2982691 RepID=UPI0021E4C69C|nr:biosynthetic peptidoglycan transglycosylase [Halomonas sp. GD1P12]UYF98863.1 transglycosylase domain-containing protein [Halomonas sp. GD1P12]